VQATVYRAGPQHRNERQRRSACLQASSKTTPPWARHTSSLTRTKPW
jgi:hypothetical protein